MIHNYLYKRWHGGEEPAQSPHLVPSIWKNTLRSFPDALAVGASAGMIAFISGNIFLRIVTGKDPSMGFARSLAVHAYVVPKAAKTAQLAFIGTLVWGAYRGYANHQPRMEASNYGKPTHPGKA